MQICYYADGGATSSAEPMDLGNGTSGQRDLNPKHQPKDPVSNDSTSAELVMSQFRGLVGSLFRSPIASKRCIRDWVVDNVAVGRRLSERVECILEHAVLSTKPSRLDDAIDILDQPRVDLTTYLRDAQFRGSLDRKPEDAIYILVRAAGRRSDDAARFVVPWALKSDQASVREAAVEALADLGTEAAISMLRRVSQFDDSSSVRETAKEVLEDIVEG